MPRNVVAVGKCAGAMLDGVAAVHDVAHAFVAIPDGYKLPATRAEVHRGGHPQMTMESFEAGRALLAFVDAVVDAHGDILFLVSGGGSACVEVPLPPHTEEELMDISARLIASGLPIAEINAERKKRSAIKGGRLGARVRGDCATLVYSDVATGRLADVASGPSERNLILVADNSTLVRAAASLVARPVVIEEQIECDVDEAAAMLAERARTLRRGEVLVAGGEPTVVVRGGGRGGRCSELAVRFAMRSECAALFGASDGVDGNTGSAGIYLTRRRDAGGTAGWKPALRESNSFEIAAQVGEPIMIAPTGNNLRDLFLVARD